MSEVQAPDFGRLLAPYLARVPAEALPRFLALLERGAADRYRFWAAELPAHAEVLLSCASSEEEIADRVDAAFALAPEHEALIHEPLPDARRTYEDVFAGVDVWDQLRIQANAERQGAQAWRNLASRVTDDGIVATLGACAALEEASADRVDALVRVHGS